MDLSFNRQLAERYKGKTQVVRVLTEDWVLRNSYCPVCGNAPLGGFVNNRPVADFYCNACNEEFELKSKNGVLAGKVADGAYATMLSRISAGNNPNFFFLSYAASWSVRDFFVVPKHFFTPDVIVKRPPLAESARRAGWVGCTIDIGRIPDAGKVFLVKGAKVASPESVKTAYGKMLFLRGKSQEAKGWILDVLKCVETIRGENFTLDDMYAFEPMLKGKYPNNNFIGDKIRQQLQVLRDHGGIEFVGRGRYRKARWFGAA